MRSMRVGDSCPYCRNRKLLRGYNDLAITHPNIAAVWNPRMNKCLKSAGVQAISRKPVWWRGGCGHVYQMAVRDRARVGQTGLLSVLLREEEAREVDKVRPALGLSARKEWGEAGRCLLPLGAILRILDWMGMRGIYGGLHRLERPAGRAGALATCGQVECEHVSERRALRFNWNGGAV